MKRIVLIFGSIAGVIVGGMFLATWPLHENGTLNPDNGMLVGYATMVIALSLIFFGVKSYRDTYLNGSISFGKALVVGLWISLVAAIIYAVTWEIMYNTIASDFLECDKILGYHFDTFGYIEINHEESIRKFFDKGKDLMLLGIGESIEL